MKMRLNINEKGKFNKKKCHTCIYHGNTSGLTANQTICNYAAITGHTCLRRNDKGDPVDIRGNDGENCKIYENGKAIKSKDNWIC